MTMRMMLSCRTNGIGSGIDKVTTLEWKFRSVFLSLAL
jgi:hypothetical protein